MGSGLRVDELHGRAQALALPLEGALQHVADPEILSDLAHIHGLALVDPGRVAGDDLELREAGEIGDDVLGDPVSQPGCRVVAAEIVEGQHRDGRFAGIGGRGRPEPPAHGASHQQQDGGGRSEPAPCHRSEAKALLATRPRAGPDRSGSGARCS